MRCSSALPSVALALALCPAAGCSHPTAAGRIADLELPEPSFSPSVFEHEHVLVRRFAEARPAEAGRSVGGGGLLVPHGYRSEYTTSYRQKGKHGTALLVGWLPFDMPYLLARSLPGDNVAVADSLTDAGADESWDYIVQGRLLTTEATSHSAAVMVYLGLVGLPVRVDRYVLRYEVSLYHASDPDHPISTRTYEFDDRFGVGLYYNQKRARDLPLQALRTTLADAARDLVTDVREHEARRGPPAAAEPTPTAVASAG